MRNVEQEVVVLKRQVKALRRVATLWDHWQNTVRSPWWKRLWWWFQGYRLLTLGRWYRAPWNSSAAKYEGIIGDRYGNHQ